MKVFFCIYPIIAYVWVMKKMNKTTQKLLSRMEISAHHLEIIQDILEIVSAKGYLDEDQATAIKRSVAYTLTQYEQSHDAVMISVAKCTYLCVDKLTHL